LIITGLQVVQDCAYGVYHFQIGFFTVSTDVVDFTGLALLQDCHDRLAMVLYVEPVADVGTIPINRESFYRSAHCE
jgi:hypothetical protein